MWMILEQKYSIRFHIFIASVLNNFFHHLQATEVFKWSKITLNTCLQMCKIYLLVKLSIDTVDNAGYCWVEWSESMVGCGIGLISDEWSSKLFLTLNYSQLSDRMFWYSLIAHWSPSLPTTTWARVTARIGLGRYDHVLHTFHFPYHPPEHFFFQNFSIKDECINVRLILLIFNFWFVWKVKEEDHIWFSPEVFNVR